jgi:hypothetical protein
MIQEQVEVKTIQGKIMAIPLTVTLLWTFTACVALDEIPVGIISLQPHSTHWDSGTLLYPHGG